MIPILQTTITIKDICDGFVYNELEGKGIFEYILGYCKNSKLLEVRIFDEVTKKTRYEIQTKLANENSVSNCSLCTHGHDSNKTRIWKLEEMDADHVTAWSKGGATSAENCEMLCKTHNRAKGNNQIFILCHSFFLVSFTHL
jgi:5-methylcytosine-specific restriction endonuclease McrA